MKNPILVSDNSKPKNFLEALQAAVIKRYGKSYGGDEPIVYEFTQDRAMIHQYHVLLETMYRRAYASQTFTVNSDIYDRLSYILIARRGNLCLGGCRLTVREHDEEWNLPLESDQFLLRKTFSDLPLNQVRHGELSRFAIMEDSGNREVFYVMCRMMYQKVQELGVQYLFARSFYPLARNWRFIANSLGAKTTRICEEIEVPAYAAIPDRKVYITLSDLSNNLSGSVNNKKQADKQQTLYSFPQKPNLELVE